MARRTQLFQKIPWDGGINDAVDPGVLNDNDLVAADNVIFATSGSRLKREGVNYFNSELPAITHREASGTSRYLYFQSLQTSSPTNKILEVGELISVVSTTTGYTAANVKILAITNVSTEYKIEYTADSSLTESKTAVTALEFTLTKAYSFLNLLDYWYTDIGFVKQQILLGASNEFNLYKFSANGDKETIEGNKQTSTVTVELFKRFSFTVDKTDLNTNPDATASYFTFSSPATDYYVYFTDTAGATADPSIGGKTAIGLNWNVGQDNETIAATAVTAIATALGSDSSVTRDGATVTVEIREFGAVAAAAADVNTGFEIVNEATNINTSPGAGRYFTFKTLDADKIVTDHYVWLDIDNSKTDPSVTGTAHVWELTTGESNETLAEALKDLIEAVTDVGSTRDEKVVTFVLENSGIVTASADVNTGLTIATTISGATDPANLDKINSLVMNNRAVFAFNGVGDKPIKYFPTTSDKYELLGGTPPDFSFMCEHQGRMWTNDKTNPDRVHYSSPGDIEEWNGAGDSGALDVGTGDGDADGITALFTFKGILFVAKRQKLYRIDGTTPENYTITLISDGIGVTNHAAVAKVDQDDVIFVSHKGVHSLAATDAFGDVNSQFISIKIQNRFNKEFNNAKINYIQAIYIDNLNSVAFSIYRRGQSIPVDIYWYNVVRKEWFRWPNISCIALSKRIAANNKTKLITGTITGQVIETQSGDYVDYEALATEYSIKTGTIYPGGDINSVKGFKSISLFYKPKGNFLFTVKVRIDNNKQQVKVFQQEAVGDELGETFILGQSVLGVDNKFAPFTQSIEGHGRGIEIEISQSGTNEQVEIYGFQIEYELEDFHSETLLG